MRNRLKARRRDIAQSLGFVPAAIVAGFAVLGIVLGELDERLRLSGTGVFFQGDADAARTVLSVIAGSLITVAGLTFSMTLVVLQLASTQFSPRILRTFFGDRMTQVTIGAYVGIFVYAILVLRSVGSVGDSGAFVPRASVTLASALGIAAAVLLIAFLHHVSKLIQVSHVVGMIASDTLGRLDRLYPEHHGEPATSMAADELLRDWRAEAPGRVSPRLPGFVKRVGLEDMVGEIPGGVERLAVLVRPGDFVSLEMPIAEVWPAGLADRCEAAIAGAVAIGPERDLEQDVDFGLRQLTDTAVKALSPGINDPTTAATCIGYLRAILVRLCGREFPVAVREFPDERLTLISARRDFDVHLDSVLEVGRYARADPRVTGELLRAVLAIARAATDSGAVARAATARRVGDTIADQAAAQLSDDRDRDAIRGIQAEIHGAARVRGG